MYKGNISVGTAIIIIQLSTHIVAPVKTSISLINQIKSVSLIANKIENILEISNDDFEEVRLRKIEKAIEVKNLYEDMKFNKEDENAKWNNIKDIFEFIDTK